MNKLSHSIRRQMYAFSLIPPYFFCFFLLRPHGSFIQHAILFNTPLTRRGGPMCPPGYIGMVPSRGFDREDLCQKTVLFHHKNA